MAAGWHPPRNSRPSRSRRARACEEGNSCRFLMEPHQRAVFALQKLPDFLDSHEAEWSLSAANDYGEKWVAHRTSTGHQVAFKVEKVGSHSWSRVR